MTGATTKSPRTSVQLPNLSLEWLPRPDQFTMPSPRPALSSNDLGPASPQHQRMLGKQFPDVNYFNLLHELRRNVSCKTNMYHLKMFECTVLAYDISKWMIASGHAQNTTEANVIGTALITHGHIYNVVDEDQEEFISNGQPYRYAADDRIGFSIDDVDLSQVERLLFYSKHKEIVMNTTMYRDALSGAEAVDLIVSKGIVVSRTDAVQICEKLLTYGSLILLRSPNKNKFEFLDDSESLYAILNHEYPAMTNAKTAPAEMLRRDDNVGNGIEGMRKHDTSFSAISTISDDSRDTEVRSLRGLWRNMRKTPNKDESPISTNKMNVTTQGTLSTPRSKQSNGISEKHPSRLTAVRKIPTLRLNKESMNDEEDEYQFSDDDESEPSLKAGASATQAVDDLVGAEVKSLRNLWGGIPKSLRKDLSLSSPMAQQRPARFSSSRKVPMTPAEGGDDDHGQDDDICKSDHDGFEDEVFGSSLKSSPPSKSPGNLLRSDKVVVKRLSRNAGRLKVVVPISQESKQPSLRTPSSRCQGSAEFEPQKSLSDTMIRVDLH